MDVVLCQLHRDKDESKESSLPFFQWEDRKVANVEIHSSSMWNGNNVRMPINRTLLCACLFAADPQEFFSSPSSVLLS